LRGPFRDDLVWTIPENFIKERVDLEATLVVIIERGGKILNGGLKKSDNTLYDPSARRVIRLRRKP